MNIFLSRPTWIAPQFEQGMAIFLTQLSNLGLKPRTLGVSDYPSKAPLDEVIEIMTQCKGAIILGAPQVEVASGSVKGIAISSPFDLATEWNQLEAGLAYAAGLPLLVIHHKTISRGIFDRGVLNAFLHSVDLSAPSWSMDSPVNGAICKWRDDCISGASNHSKQLDTPTAFPGKPVCPNCSSSRKPIYMRPLPPPFSEIAGGEWECPLCNFVQ